MGNELSDKTANANHLPKSIDTLIGAGVRMEADVTCTGVLRVQGEILGNVSCDQNSSGMLIVDSAGSVTGTVSAAHVSVRGRIVGPVRSQQSIEVHQGGSLVGDISFREIAIHAGGVVDGVLTPVPANDAAGSSSEPAAAPAKTGGPAQRAGGMWKAAAAVLAVAAVGGGVWLSRNPEVLNRTGEAKADVVLNAPLESSAPVTSKVPEAETAPTAPVAVAVPEPAPPATPETADKPHDNVISVRGINPSRPAGVFLLVSNEPSILYRKKRDDTGEGARIAVPAGEKASVGVASDELIRVAQGRDVVILFQGAKVPKNVIESGAWISFVPR
jgi:cytoskeletal protein CcmA (bactofilin family)